MKSIIFVVATFVMFTGMRASGADLTINVDQVKVYSQPNPNSSVMTTLFKNDTIKASNKPVPGFQKVLVNGKDIGYIKNSDLLPRVPNLKQLPGAKQLPQAAGLKPMQMKNQPLAQKANMVRRRVVARRSRGISQRMAISVLGGLNYQTQGSRNYVAPDGSAANISALSGLNIPILGVQVQFPITSSISLRAFVEFVKSVSVSGSATYQTNPLVTAVPTDTFLKEQFLSFGLMGAYYFSPMFWGGAGLQVDHANSGTLKFGSFPETALSGTDLPNFFMGFGAIGYDFEVTSHIFLTPELRVGALFSKPLIIEVDALVNAAYAF